MGDVAHRQALFAPRQQHHRVDEQRHEEVHQHTAHHHQQALPGRLVFEQFVSRNGSLFFGYGIGIGALIDHTGDFDIAPKGQPADGKLRTTPFA